MKIVIGHEVYKVYQKRMKRLSSLILCFFLIIGIVNAQHLKKDGTPDWRFKENKAT